MKKIIPLIILLFLFTLTGCRSLIPCVNPLAGTQWKLVSWLDNSLDPSQFDITAYFDEKTIWGKAAVNYYSGTYRVRLDHSFSVGELQMILMGGSEEAMQAESTYWQLLQKASQYILNTGTLILYDQLGQESLVFFRISEKKGLADVTRVDVLIAESFPVQVFVVAQGYLPDPCTEIGPIMQERIGNNFYITINTYPSQEICICLITPFTRTISLDVHDLPAGQYTVNVNGIKGYFVLD